MVSIFIRTYRNDLNWLDYCLKSIHKNLTGWDEIVVCIPTGQEHLLSHLTAEKVVVCKTYRDDYIGQQISKLEAYKHVKGEYVLFVDSDVVFFEGANVLDYFENNKPVILKDIWANVGDAICWKPIMERLFKEGIQYEYMRRAPQMFYTSTLINFAYHFSDIENYSTTQPKGQFTEFNFLGYFAEKHEPDSYVFIDLSTGAAIPINKSRQFWSWSGLTQKERIELEESI